jgi:GntR family transcriptional regulator
MADPMYRQIADDLQRRIHSGELPRGTQIPTEIELREHYNASRNTVRDAIKWLTTRGQVETRPGQGTFVSDKINPFVTTLTGQPEGGPDGGETAVYIAEVEASGRAPTNSEPRVEIQKASGVMATALGVEDGTQVVSRHQRRFIDGTPWSLQTSFYPMSLVLSGASRLLEATNIRRGAVAYLAKECGVTQVGYSDSIAVRVPDDVEAAFFKLPSDGRVSVFEIQRVGFGQDKKPFRVTVTVYPADRNRFLVHVGAVASPETLEAEGTR